MNYKKMGRMILAIASGTMVFQTTSCTADALLPSLFDFLISTFISTIFGF